MVGTQFLPQRPEDKEAWLEGGHLGGAGGVYSTEPPSLQRGF